jgi:hypothetical protein
MLDVLVRRHHREILPRHVSLDPDLALRDVVVSEMVAASSEVDVQVVPDHLAPYGPDGHVVQSIDRPDADLVLIHLMPS